MYSFVTLNGFSMFERLLSFDEYVFLKINSWHNPFFDKVMWFISGKTEWIPVYLIIFSVIIFKFRKKTLYILLGLALVISLADLISAQLIKDSVKRLRPSHVCELNDLIHLVKNYHGGRYGFVSNHAANFFGMATFLSLIFKNKWATISLFFWACLVSYSRIYLGVHYPGDIIGGAILGSMLALIIYKLLLVVLKRLNKDLYTSEN
ncbi:MAG: phosphatase PAP2 family protein [Bacteroidales bacterium]|nr:phosphatase PAP2 family protein [Bacteroidales bacterium]